MERLIYARIKPIVDPLLPQEQAGFRCDRSSTDQVTLLTQGIENSFSAKKKASAVFVDFAAAYDSVWHRGLTCKFLRTLPDRHIVSFIMELVRNRSFTLITGNGAQSTLRRLNSGVPQESILEVYLRRRPGHHAFCRRLSVVGGNSHTGHGNPIIVLTEMEAEAQYHKTVTAAFHLYNKEAAGELNVAAEGHILPFSAEPTYLGIELDRSLTYRRHLASLRKKLTRVGLLRRLAGSSWGAGARTLRVATLALIHSAAEYYAPV